MKSKVLYGAVLVALSWLAAIPADANPVTLVCINPSHDYSWMLTIDDVAEAAGGFKATFKDQEVTWFNTENYLQYTLNRVTGDLVIRGKSTIIYSCHIGQKKL